jgi:hypothetical protein
MNTGKKIPERELYVCPKIFGKIERQTGKISREFF